MNRFRRKEQRKQLPGIAALGDHAEGLEVEQYIKIAENKGYSKEDSTYAADNCGADWDEQAAKKAQEYMDYSAFSRSKLIDQLEYEKFTTSQAEYGAKAVGY